MIQPYDLIFFVMIVKERSLSAAARELSVTPAAISKRLAKLEDRLGVALMNRTTRQLRLTEEGELYYDKAVEILAELEDLETLVSSSQGAPKGLLRVNAPLGFGRTYITPIVSKFVRQYPKMEIQLQLTDHPLNLLDQVFDVGIRFGEMPDTTLIAKKIAANRRLVCSSPAYLKKNGIPKVPHDLMDHNCVVLRQNDAAYGLWRFTKNRKSEAVKVRGTLSSNDGEVALNWVLDGHGIMLRAEWDIAKYVRSGRLQIVLEDYEAPPADIFAVYPQRHKSSAKIRAFTEFLVTSFTGEKNQKNKKPQIW